MLEILIVVVLTKKVGEMLARKGHTTRWPYQVLFVCLWFGGEVLGAVGGTILAFTSGAIQPDPVSVYVCALIGAATGAAVAFILVHSLPAHEPRRPEEEDFLRAPRDIERAERLGRERFSDEPRPALSQEPGRYRGVDRRFRD